MQNPADRPNEAEQVAKVIAEFPEEFGLRAYPGKRFSISQSASYVSDFPKRGTIYLYTVIKTEKGWSAFCKGTAEELRAQITK